MVYNRALRHYVSDRHLCALRSDVLAADSSIFNIGVEAQDPFELGRRNLITSNKLAPEVQKDEHA